MRCGLELGSDRLTGLSILSAADKEKIMTKVNSITFTPTGWLDASRTSYWDKGYQEWLTLFGKTADGNFVKADLIPCDDPFVDESRCCFEKNGTKETESIFLEAMLFIEHYDRIYSIFTRNSNSLGNIEVSVSYKAPDTGSSVVELQVVGITVKSHEGKFIDGS